MNAVLTLIFWLLMQFGAPNPLCSETGVDSDKNHASCPQFEVAPPPVQHGERRTMSSSFINNGF